MSPFWFASVFFLVLRWRRLSAEPDFVEGDIRLVGGQHRYMGTVVIYHDGRWGAICDNNWDLRDAKVVCKQLGYTKAVKASVRSQFGPGNPRMWMTYVQCGGHEARLANCRFQGYDITTKERRCPGLYRSAGVVCNAGVETTTTATTTTTTTTTTTETTTASATTKNVKRRQKNKTAKKKKSRYTTTTAAVTASAAPTSTTMPASTVPPRSELEEELLTWSRQNNQTEAGGADSELLIPFAMVDNTKPAQDGQKLLDVAKNDSPFNISAEEYKITNDAKGADDVKGVDDVKNIEDKKHNQVVLADEPIDEQLEVRLQGGRYKWEGYVEVRVKDGEWGSVCSDKWTLREVMVVCTQLKDIGKARQALLTSYFGGSGVPKSYHRIQCVGRESNLGQCNLTRTDEKLGCALKTNVAGVVCSQHLPDLVPNLRAVEDSVRLQDVPLYYLRCSMEENCLAKSAYVIHNTSLVWRNNMRRLLRFSTVVHNRGVADFRPFLPRGQWEWHSCHMHYHSMEVFAHYDIMDSNGTRLAEGSKASFCLEDSACDKGVHPKYNCRGFADQGLSVNCSDNYMYDIDCQWIDITDIKPGEYTFLMEVNPEMLVAESDFDNNVVRCHLYYSGYFASLKSCHFESLLEYRRPMKPS
ncbi:unnamed protein product [Lymnaea stagnalis]|uniref:protein-lysine 6-oxidase n=1 Tax=Lymnaea stagnalis TaxID=6523 RepID=A0AAV2H0E8_LYMST